MEKPKRYRQKYERLLSIINENETLQIEKRQLWKGHLLIEHPYELDDLKPYWEV